MNKYFFSLLLLFISTISQAEVVFHDSLGQTKTLSSLAGKWVFINYWAVWCDTCLAEIPELNRFYEKHKNDNVVLYGINYDALPAGEQRRIIKKLHIKYPNLLNDPAGALRLGDITGVPVTFVFNTKGRLVKKLYGGQRVKNLEAVMR